MNDYPIVANAETIRLITFSASDPRRNPLASSYTRASLVNVGRTAEAEGWRMGGIPLSRMR